MKLVNCPVCGNRCSADIEKCPECGFEIRQYFDKKTVSKKNKKVPLLLIGCACLAILAAIFIANTISDNKSELSKHTESAEPLEEIFPETEAVQTNTTSSELLTSDIDVSGVYSGDDHEILVLSSDGLAYYYCTEIAFTELECPWYIKDDNVHIELSRLHCIVTAKVDEKELLFKSESANWNTELFTRLDVEPEQYLTKALSTHDPNATLNSDGTLTYTLDGISYTLPKTFIDLKDESDNESNWSAFIDEDVQSDFVSGVLFYKSLGSLPKESSVNDYATDFASRFLTDASIVSCTATTVAGYPGYLCEVTGYFNQGFNALQNYKVSGYIAIFNNEDTHNNDYVMLVQNSDRSTDNSTVFGDILKSARK
ncbi:MAG: hypothetical protein J5959_21190 [Butyrivibrio sp.]|nr:hypothetical protein [Butyrivibrio sp.]